MALISACTIRCETSVSDLKCGWTMFTSHPIHPFTIRIQIEVIRTSMSTNMTWWTHVNVAHEMTISKDMGWFLRVHSLISYIVLVGVYTVSCSTSSYYKRFHFSSYCGFCFYYHQYTQEEATPGKSTESSLSILHIKPSTLLINDIII